LLLRTLIVENTSLLSFVLPKSIAGKERNSLPLGRNKQAAIIIMVKKYVSKDSTLTQQGGKLNPDRAIIVAVNGTFTSNSQKIVSVSFFSFK